MSNKYISKLKLISNKKSIGCNYGSHRNENFSFFAFFQFFVFRRKMGDEKRKINFLHFLAIFNQILAFFDDFSKFHIVSSTFHLEKWHIYIWILCNRGAFKRYQKHSMDGKVEVDLLTSQGWWTQIRSWYFSKSF